MRTAVNSFNMNHWKNWQVGLSLLLLLFGFSPLALGSDIPPPRLVVLLVDLSGSAAQKQSREFYLRRAKEIVGTGDPEASHGLKAGERIVIGAIQDQSAVKGIFTVNEELPVYNHWKHNPLKYRALFGEKVTNIHRKLEELLRQPVSPGTEIMSALVPAQQVFASFPDYPRKILVIMSDMIEESSRYNFQKKPPEKKDIDLIIINEKKQDRLPDLKGVKVYVVGAGGKSSDDMLKIKDFWLAYFQACGADINPANYGADLVKFE